MTGTVHPIRTARDSMLRVRAPRTAAIHAAAVHALALESDPGRRAWLEIIASGTAIDLRSGYETTPETHAWLMAELSAAPVEPRMPAEAPRMTVEPPEPAPAYADMGLKRCVEAIQKAEGR